MPEVSVVIATYNRGALLERALDSVFGQTFEDYEVLVADDGSTDDTPERLKKHRSRVRVLQLEHQGRPARVRNRAIQEASGKYLAFLDSDDLWAPEKLERQVGLMRQDPELVLCYTDSVVEDENGRFLHVHSRRERPRRGWVLDALLQTNFIPVPTVLARTDLVSSAGGFEESLRMAEDWCLWVRLALKGRIGFVDERLCTIRVGHQTITSDKAALFQDALRAIDIIQAELPAGSRKHRASLRRGRAKMASMLARNYLFSGRAGDARRLYSKTLANDPLRVEALPFYALSLLGARPAVALRALKRGLCR
jgi:glycosyltransferase involved in cell wall biosynthesis